MNFRQRRRRFNKTHPVITILVPGETGRVLAMLSPELRNHLVHKLLSQRLRK